MVVMAGSLLLSACTSGASPTSRTSKNSNSTTTQKISAAWTAFFKGTTPATEKIALLQNGSEFASYIKSQAKSATAKAVSVEVTKVKITSKTSATVTYTILINKNPALADASGKAVLQNGKWKVGDASFCALLSLQGTASQVKACAKA